MSSATWTRFVKAQPYVALGVFVLALVLVLAWGARRANLAKRPVLFGAVVLGAAPALYVALVWAELISSTYVRFHRPALTLVGALAVAFVALRLAAWPAKIARARRVLGDLLVPAAALALGLAAAGPELGKPLDRLTVILAIDRSRSIDLVTDAEARIAQELRVAENGMKEGDLIGTVVFGASAATEDPPRPKSDIAAPQRVIVGRDGSDLSAAIRRSLAEVPPDTAARIVLISDGVATRGDAMSAAAAAVAAEVPVDVITLDQRAVADVRVVAVRGPSRADEGEPMDLRLVTQSPQAAEIEVRIKRDGEVISKARASIAAGEDVLRIREKAPSAGLHRYDVEVTAVDPRIDFSPDDNSGSTFVRVRGVASALVLDGQPGRTQFVAKALAEASYRVEEGSASSVPGDLAGLAAYDVVFLSDIAASDLSPSQLEAIASYVRDLGGGLVLLGGDKSMGPGGYGKTPVEEISPVSFDLKQERRRASLAEVIGIDISGSMAARAGAHTKLELANEAAARSAALLGAGDQLGVAHVDTKVYWSVPLGPVTDKAKIDAAIRGVGVGGGGILCDITLFAAYAALDKVGVNLKHVLLFADGDDAETLTPQAFAATDSALKRGITTSVISLGSGHDTAELEKLSRKGGGRFYLVEDATKLPAVFAQETILAARSAIVEKDFKVAKGAGSSVTAGIDFAQAPALKGYVVTIPKSRATVLLTGPDGDPVLTTWAAGLGRSAAFTSDLKDRWGVAWTSWPGAARLVAQVARDVSRKGDDPRVRLEADASGGQLHVRATVVGDDGRAQSFRRLVVQVAGPDGFSQRVALEPSGAGAYTSTVALSRPGPYIAVATDELTGAAVGTTGAVLSAGEELRPTGSDAGTLARIADFTGGKKRDTSAGIFLDRDVKRFSYTEITRWVIFGSALGFLLMVGARRLAAPTFLAAWGAKLAARRDAAKARRAEAKKQAAKPVVVEGVKPGVTPGASPMAARQPVASAAPVATSAPQVPSASASASAQQAGAPSSQRRPMTAAEAILAKRRGKKP